MGNIRFFGENFMILQKFQKYTGDSTEGGEHDIYIIIVYCIDCKI